MEDPKTIDGFFAKVYILMGYLAAVGVLLITVISLYDNLALFAREIGQMQALSLKHNLHTVEGIEYLTLKYAKNNPANEPYNIFLQQKILSNFGYLIGGFFFIFVVDLCVGVAMYVAKNRKINAAASAQPAAEPAESAAANKFAVGFLKTRVDVSRMKDGTYLAHPYYIILKPLLAIVLLLIFIIACGTHYTATFVKIIQPDIIYLNENVNKITKNIYDNLSKNEEFLKAIQDDNLSKCYDIIKSQGNQPDTIASMIFTLSLLNFYRRNANTSLEKIKPIFSLYQIRFRKIIPIEYIYYDTNPYIQNLYTELNDKKTFEEIFSGKNNSLKITVRKYVSERINSLNKLLVSLYKLKRTRDSIRSYLLSSLLISFTFLIIFATLYPKIWESVKKIFKKIKEIIRSAKNKNA